MGQCAGQAPSRHHNSQPLPEGTPSGPRAASPRVEEAGRNINGSINKGSKVQYLANTDESDEKSSASWQSSLASIGSPKGTGPRESERMEVSRLQTLVPSEMKKHLKRRPLA